MSNGWGAQPWGGSPWGGFAPVTTMTLVSALAIAENVIQLQFSDPVYLSGLLDLPDASNPDRFSVTIVPNTSGLDGTDTRPVTVASIALAQPAVDGGDLPSGAQFGTYVDLTLDRAMTPYPSQYTVVANGLFSADLSKIIDPNQATQTLYGVYAEILQPSVSLPTPTRDFSNPQSIGAGGALLLPGMSLGTFSVGSDRDYSFDQGFASYKKRVIRRLVTKPGGFVHLGNDYGVGILSQGKKLATAQVQSRISSQAQKQIAQEPETDRVLVKLSASNNGLVRLTTIIQPKGAQPIKYVTDIPTQT